jgi:hypothetical protein
VPWVRFIKKTADAAREWQQQKIKTNRWSIAMRGFYILLKRKLPAVLGEKNILESKRIGQVFLF